jgi:uncharacterized protein YbjQ (UPF0145 family)
MALISRFSGSFVCTVLLAGCSTSSHVMTGTAHAPIPPDSVRIYNQPPPGQYEQIATVTASSQGSLAIGSQRNMDKAIARLKEEAAKLGANGILLQNIEDQRSSSVGIGIGGSSYSGASATGVGVGGSSALTSKVVSGVAIYLPQ